MDLGKGMAPYPGAFVAKLRFYLYATLHFPGLFGLYLFDSCNINIFLNVECVFCNRSRGGDGGGKLPSGCGGEGEGAGLRALAGGRLS